MVELLGRLPNVIQPTHFVSSPPYFALSSLNDVKAQCDDFIVKACPNCLETL